MFTKIVAVAVAAAMLTTTTAMAAAPSFQLAQAAQQEGVSIQSEQFTYEQGFLEGERQAEATSAGKLSSSIRFWLRIVFREASNSPSLISPSLMASNWAREISSACS